LFSLLSRPDVISLAGGFPSAAALDLNGLRGATERALISSLATSFQYGNREGYEPLRELIAQRARTKGMKRVLRRAPKAHAFAVVVCQCIDRADWGGYPASPALYPVGAR
jgi:hypothetical protein